MNRKAVQRVRYSGKEGFSNVRDWIGEIDVSKEGLGRGGFYII